METPLSAAERSETNDERFNWLVAELWQSGWKHDGERLGLMQAVAAYCTNSSKRLAGYRAPVNGRLPWRGGGTTLGVDVHNGIRKLYTLTCLQVVGKPTVPGVIKSEHAAWQQMEMIGYIARTFERIPVQLQDEIVGYLTNWRFRALMLLDEERPDKEVPLICPRCEVDDAEQRPLYLKSGDGNHMNLAYIFCRECGERWTVEELGWLGRLAGDAP